MSEPLDLVKIARAEQEGNLFALLDSMYKRSSTVPAGCSDAVIWEGGINLDPDVLYRDLVSTAVAALH